jgi:hypothetical protein
LLAALSIHKRKHAAAEEKGSIIKGYAQYEPQEVGFTSNDVKLVITEYAL